MRRLRFISLYAVFRYLSEVLDMQLQHLAGILTCMCHERPLFSVTARGRLSLVHEVACWAMKS